MSHRRRDWEGLRLLAIVCLALTGLLAAAGGALAATYPDVPQDHRFATAIYSLADQGIVSGFQDGSFGPDSPVNRGQFAKIVVGGVGAHTPSPDYPTPAAEATFPDVSADS